MNIYGKIAKYFIENKKFSFLVLISIILWGIISFIIMPKQYNPDIIAPAFRIDVNFPGAAVDEVYQIVTKPLEDVLNEISGVENIYSRSIHGGKSSVIVQFYIGEDIEKSMIILRQKVSSRLNLKPLGVSDPSIVSIDPDALPIKTLALYSNKINAINLRKRAFKIKDELRQISDVSIINIIGGRRQEFKIILDPNKMAESKTSLDEIGKALNHTSLLKVLGLIKGKDNYFQIEFNQQVVTIKDIENIVIVSNIENTLTLKDIARIVKKSEEHNNYVNFYKKNKDIKNVVYIALSKKKGMNISAVSSKVDQVIKGLKQRTNLFEDIEVETVRDEGRVAAEEINGLIINLIQAIGIVFIVLLCFLNYRAAFIVAFSIPITLLSVLALGNLFGYTINRITLFALILSLGLLVDSATVVIENIVKNKKTLLNLSKIELISKSVSEVGVGLFLSTLTTVLAFIPMGFISGLMGPYMGPLPFFVSCALIVSLIFSYTLNPWLASFFCKDNNKSLLKEKCGFICKTVNLFLDLYKKILNALLLSRKKRIILLSICLGVLLIVLTFPLFKLLRFRMLPKADREQIYVYIDLNRGTSIEKTNQTASYFAGYLAKQKQVKSIQSFVGLSPILDFNGLFKGAESRSMTHQITLKLNLTHPNKRKIKSEELAFKYRSLLKEKSKKYPDARIQIIEDPPGPPVVSTFHIKIKSKNTILLNQAAYDIEKKAGKIDQVKDIDISILEENQKFVLSIDKIQAAKSKISVDSISKELETLFKGRIIGIYHSSYNYEQEYIVLEFDRNLRNNIKDLDNIFVINEYGNHVPISAFIKIKKENEHDIILNDNRERTVYISGEMGKRSSAYAAIDCLKILYNYSIPHRKVKLEKISLFKAEYIVDNKEKLIIELGGEWELTIKVFRDLGLAMLAALSLIYLVLVAQFKSYLIPLLIFGTIPLALIGIIPGFALLFLISNIYFSATSMIGVIALAGIVVNNAIIFIEYTLQIAKLKQSLRETLLESGQVRMRPILLTSITTVLGSLVIANDPVWSGLSWAIVCGLSFSALLTLIIFPVLIYEFLGEKWFRDVKERKINEYKSEEL